MSLLHRPRHALAATVAATGLVGGVLSAVTATPALAGATGHQGDLRSCLTGSHAREAVFDRAARATGVPRAVLMGVSYMESRWDAHGASPSTSGGFGPMNLTQVRAMPRVDVDLYAKGDGSRVPRPSVPQSVRPTEARYHTLDLAARVSGLPASQLRTDATANICGGAALLAHYQRQAGAGHRLGDWSAAVAKYSTATLRPTAMHFVHQVFTVIRHGQARVTNDGHRVALASHPQARPRAAAVRSLGWASAKVPTSGVDCPSTLSCYSVPAPYQETNSTGSYGNHDIADRPNAGSPKIRYIVIHDTEATWDTTLKLVQDPTYVSWNYTIRSADGQVAQHVNNKDVAYHAGNWYVNMHSIGIEHEGFAPQGATWFTEAMYQDSAALVSHLSAEYNIPLDRAHIIGHDQVPGIDPAHVAGMHWDPGPYWDWEHYFTLLGHPIQADRTGTSAVVTVAPGFANNQQPVTGCDTTTTPTTNPCPAQGTNFVYLHQSPSPDSPLVTDAGQHPDGSQSTTYVADVSARAAAGQKLLVVAQSGDWYAVWWLGNIAWLYSPATAPTVVPSTGQVVVPNAGRAIPVYGTAYPVPSDYPSGVPYTHPRVALQYTIQPGQAYVLADKKVQTDYYNATVFNCRGANQCVDILGADQFYQIWFGHRIAYVNAADVTIKAGRPGVSKIAR